ncbi:MULTISPECIES: hypothetical protein [unclassified Bradyrhizobium]|uniref:hypothetical protein n=1 Tax=unclassified Bradyrhizobium TaxID=2631580 RepID=UPI0028F051FF|nr:MULTISPECIES: hypothetical protein [unclassified Bradyrhizobium]
MSHTRDDTTTKMIDAAFAHRAEPDVDSVASALIEAGFRAFEISMRIDAVIAGLRAVRRTVTIPVLDVA